MAAGAGAAIGFYLQLEDNMSPVLNAAARSYNTLTSSIDRMNTVVQARGNSTITTLQRMNREFTTMPAKARTAVSSVNRIVAATTAARSPFSQALASSIARSVSNAIRASMSRVSLHLSPDGSGMGYTGNFAFLAKGGIVNGPTAAVIGEGGSSEAVVPLNKRALKTPLIDPMQKVIEDAIDHSDIDKMLDSIGRAPKDAPIMVSSQQEIDRLLKSMNAMADSVDDMNANVRAMNRNYDDSSETFQRTASASYDMGNAFTYAGDAGSDMSGVLITAGLVVWSLTSLAGAAFLALELMTSALDSDTHAAKLFGKSTSQLARESEKAFNTIRVQLGLTQKQFQAFSLAVLDTAANYSTSLDSMMAVAAIGAQWKLNAAEMKEFGRVATLVSQAFNADESGVARLLIGLRGMRVELQESEKLLSGIAHLIKTTPNFTFDDASGAITRNTDSLEKLRLRGGDVSEAILGIAAAQAVFNSAMVDSSTSEAFIYRIMESALDPTRLGDIQLELSQIANLTGKSMDSLINSVKSGDVASVFAGMVDVFANVPVERQAALASALEQSYGPGTLQMIQKIQLMQKRGIDVTDSLAEAQNAYRVNTALAAMAAENLNTVGDKLSRTWTALGALFTDLGRRFLWFTNVLVGGLLWAVERVVLWYTNLSDSTRNLISWLGPLLKLVNAAITLWFLYIIAMGALTAAVWLGSKALEKLGYSTDSVTWSQARLYKSTFLLDMQNRIGNALLKVKNFLMEAYNTLTKKATLLKWKQWIAEKVSNLTYKLGTKILKAYNFVLGLKNARTRAGILLTIKDTAATVARTGAIWAARAAMLAFNATVSLGTLAWAGFTAAIGGFIAGLGKTSVWLAVLAKISVALKWIGVGIKAIFSAGALVVAGKILAVLSAISATAVVFYKLGNFLYDVIEGLVTGRGVVDSFRNAWENLVTWVKDTGKWIADSWLGKLLGLSSVEPVQITGNMVSSPASASPVSEVYSPGIRKISDPVSTFIDTNAQQVRNIDVIEMRNGPDSPVSASMSPVTSSDTFGSGQVVALLSEISGHLAKLVDITNKNPSAARPMVMDMLTLRAINP